MFVKSIRLVFYNKVKQFLFLFTGEIAQYFSLGPVLDLLPLS
jgi:hypothetical protein